MQVYSITNGKLIWQDYFKWQNQTHYTNTLTKQRTKRMITIRKKTTNNLAERLKHAE